MYSIIYTQESEREKEKIKQTNKQTLNKSWLNCFKLIIHCIPFYEMYKIYIVYAE